MRFEISMGEEVPCSAEAVGLGIMVPVMGWKWAVQLCHWCLEDLLAIAERERAPLVAAGCHLAFADIAEARMQSVQALEQLEAAVATLERHQEFALYEAALSRLEEARAASSNGGRRRPDGLSEREVEVIQQLADGKTNAQVGELLVISPGTVGRHVSNILNKTGLSNRTQLARYATEHGLLDD